MQMLILCGGLGTRLRPLTDNTPKPMVLIDEKPFLQYLIEYYKKQGVDNFVLAVGYLREQIIAYFGDGDVLGVKISYSVEESPLGTGGAIKEALDLLEDDFFVVNGDTFMEVDLNDLRSFHKQKKALCTIGLKFIKRNQNSGFVQVGGDNEIVNFLSGENQKNEGFINAGIYVMNKDFSEFIPEGKVSLEDDVFAKIPSGIYGQQIKNGYFIDIGTFDTYNRFVEEFHKIDLWQ